MHDGDAERNAASLQGWVARWAAELETGEQVADDGEVVPLYFTL